MAHDETDDTPTGDDAERPAPTRRARFSILLVGLVAYVLLALMCLLVLLAIALRYGWIR